MACTARVSEIENDRLSIGRNGGQRSNMRQNHFIECASVLPRHGELICAACYAIDTSQAKCRGSAIDQCSEHLLIAPVDWIPQYQDDRHKQNAGADVGAESVHVRNCAKRQGRKQTANANSSSKQDGTERNFLLGFSVQYSKGNCGQQQNPCSQSAQWTKRTQEQ